MSQRALIAVVAFASVCGCAATQSSSEQMNQATIAIRDAEQADAVAMAPAPLQSARASYAKAEEAVRKDEELQASRLAEEATVDAKLASATARAKRAERSLEEMRRSREALQQEATH